LSGAGGTGSGNNNFPGINRQFSATNNSAQARAGQGTGFGPGSGTGNGPGTAVGGTGTSAPYAPGVSGPAGQSGGPNVAGGTPGGTAAMGSTTGNVAMPAQQGNAQALSVQGGAPRPAHADSAANQTNSAGGSAGQGSATTNATGGNQGGTQSTPSGAQANGASANTQKSTNAKPARNSNWGLPASFGKTTAVTRPMRIVCLPDRFVVVPDKGDDRAAAVIGISPQVQPAEVDAFVAAVQKRLTSWGPAMTNGYWKPVLQVEVSRGAEAQFETLQTLLQGSGFEVQRKAQP
jgi:hypothetical protein